MLFLTFAEHKFSKVVEIGVQLILFNSQTCLGDAVVSILSTIAIDSSLILGQGKNININNYYLCLNFSF